MTPHSQTKSLDKVAVAIHALILFILMGVAAMSAYSTPDWINVLIGCAIAAVIVAIKFECSPNKYEPLVPEEL